MGWLDGKVVTDMGFGNQADWDDASKTIDINDHTWKSMVKKCYRGDTLIYERNAWDYILENIDFTNGYDPVSEQKPIWAEIDGNTINPFSSENIHRNFTMLINVNTQQSTASGNDIGVIGKIANNRNYAIEIGLGSNGIYYDRYGLNVSTGYNTDRTQSCDIQNKDILIQRKYDASENKYIITCDVDGYTPSTGNDHVFSYYNNPSDNPYDTQAISIGGVGMGSWHYFTGHLNYFKFGWF